MIKNGKLFLPPSKDGSDFKELFKQLAAAGAGRPLGSDGFPAGPWTPELLAEAISQIDSNRIGVDLRTVQLWFQENEKGISTANIRWLARIFGCDDPMATSEWQMELSAAQSRLAAKRRDLKNAGSSVGVPDPLRTTIVDGEMKSPPDSARDTDTKRPRRRFGLATRSEALFSRGSPLNLPASVFAGAAALGFLSYITGIHNASYGRPDGVVKQVGFLWAPNWTFVFMVLLPLFCAFVIELLGFWKHEARLKLAALADRMQSDEAWERNVEASSYTYWAVFLICLLFAGLFQWIEVCLIPLVNGGGNYAMDWGKLALVHPEVISVPEAVLFTGIAYLYMCLCFYIFFVGLILLYTVVYDLWRVGKATKHQPDADYQHEFDEVGLRVMRGIFRCTVLGVLIAICMKVQSSYLTSSGENVAAWLVSDISSAFYGRNNVRDGTGYRMPTHFSSLLIVISTCVVFLFASVRLGVGSRFRVLLRKMAAVVSLLVAGYLLIGALAGFSILLGVGVLFATYGLFDPGFGQWRATELGNHQRVS
ncbi:RcgA family putative transporter [Sinorhizobium fredii]|uniref:RcgA family putative transporter n=1 Tax=Rhizobium fredii TaxID=380 RepID=UPI003392F4BE